MRRMMLCLFAILFAAGSLVASAPVHAQKDKKDKKGSKTKEEKPKDPPRKLLIFPSDTPEGNASQLEDAVTRILERRLNATEVYSTTVFTISTPVIRRALTDKVLEQKDVSKPYDNILKAKKLATMLGYVWVATAAIGDYQYDEDKRQVTLDLAIRIVDFSGEKPALKTVAETMTSPANPPKDHNELKIAFDLIRDLGEKLMTDLLKPKQPEKPKEEPKNP